MPLLLYNFSNNGPINVKPQGGGGEFHGNQSQIPHPEAPPECQFPTTGD